MMEKEGKRALTTSSEVYDHLFFPEAGEIVNWSAFPTSTLLKLLMPVVSSSKETNIILIKVVDYSD